MQAPREARSGALALAGVALIVFGGWGFIRAFVPSQILDVIDRSAGPIGLVVLGILVIFLSRRGAFTVPRSGTRLYRSRSDRLLGGVLGGLGAYLGVDPLILRIVVALLTLMGAGALVVAYIVMWVVVPEEPVPAAPGAWQTPTPPAPPVPGAYETPAPAASPVPGAYETPAPPAPPVPGA